MYKFVLSFTSTVLCAATVFGFPHLFGYSGAPGSFGTCASSCHGFSGGTIQVTGFPTEYVPDANYMVTVSHSGGESITQFNGSCRIGDGDQNAGKITAGTNTSTYSAFNETNGIHFSNIDQTSGTFQWTAPSPGAGEVTLYIAGIQGGHFGQNSILALTATEVLNCCLPPLTGNVDYDPSDVMDISDLIYLIDYMFVDGPAPVCPEEANTNGEGGIDISDLVWLIDYMFTGGPEPVACS